jgi:FtsZ-binding cell division protein ZapB
MGAVERNLSIVREQELPSLRSEMERKYHDLRIETHGWAEVAIKASRKVDSASEIVNLIYTEVRETKDDVRAVRGELTEFRTEMRGEVAGLHGEVAEVRGEVAGLHGEVAGLHGEMAGVRSEMAGIQRELTEQGDTLQKILAKVS